MNKKDLSEADIRTKFITPALVGPDGNKWDVMTQLREEVYFTKGRVIVRGKTVTRGEKRKVDYLLFYKPNLPIAIVEAKDNNHSVGAGMEQAIAYAESLDVPFAYSSNGDTFLEHDRTATSGAVEREIPLDQFPSPEDLWARYRAAKGYTGQQEAVATQDYYDDGSGKSPRYYQTVAINRTVDAIARGENRILLVMATGTGKTYTAFQIIWRLWKSKAKKRILFLVDRNNHAPNGRVVRIDPANPAPANWKSIIEPKADTIDTVRVAAGKVIATYMKDVASKAYVHNLEGALENEIELPGLGSASGFAGNMDDTSLFYTYTSFTYPTSIFRYDVAARKSSLFRAPEIPGLDVNQYDTKQVFVTSKDGAKVPMFLVHKKGLALDGTNPTLMYGYGGFNIATTPARLAAQGGSNGRLLVGAVINQRPELFRAAIPQVGVMDMLRFHKFTIGWNWIADYGSSDNAEEFRALHAYSPLHNITPGGKYPATLITTADHDDRVVPAHSFKYAATLQKHASPDRPALIRIDTKSGHGASNVTKQIEATADIYAFLMFNLGVTPNFK